MKRYLYMLAVLLVLLLTGCKDINSGAAADPAAEIIQSGTADTEAPQQAGADTSEQIQESQREPQETSGLRLLNYRYLNGIEYHYEFIEAADSELGYLETVRIDGLKDE